MEFVLDSNFKHLSLEEVSYHWGSLSETIGKDTEWTMLFKIIATFESMTKVLNADQSNTSY